MGKGRDAQGARFGANGGHARGSQTGGAGIAAAGKCEDEPVATTAVTAGMKQLRKGQGKMRRRGEGPCGCLDFTGVWSFDFAGQPVVQTGTVTISERDGIIIVTRNFIYEGANETFFYRDVIDTENKATIHTAKDVKSKTKWDHDILRVTTTQPGSVTTESYSLAADGTMMVSVVRPDHKPIALFLERK